MRASLFFLIVAVISAQFLSDVDGKKSRGKKKRLGGLLSKICSDDFDDTNFSVCTSDGKTVTDKLQLCEKKEGVKFVHMGSCGNCQREQVCPSKPKESEDESFDEMVEKEMKMFKLCNYAVAKCEKFKEDGSILSMKEYKESQSPSNDEEKKSRGKKSRRGGLSKKFCSASVDDTNFSACTSDGNTVTDRTELCENKEGLKVVHLGSCGNCEREQLCQLNVRKGNKNSMNEKKKKMVEFFCNYMISKCKQFEEDGSILSIAEYKETQSSSNDEEKKSRGKKSRRGGLLKKICSDSFDDTNFSVCTSDGNTVTDKTVLCENKEGLKIVHKGSCGNCEREQLCPARSENSDGSLRPDSMNERKKKMIEFVCNYKIARCEQFEQDGTILSMAEYKESKSSSNDEEKKSRGKKNRRGGLSKKFCSASADDTNFSACTSDGNTITDKTELCENKEGLKIVHLGSCGNCEREQLCQLNVKKGNENSMNERKKKMFEFFCNYMISKCKQFEEDGSILSIAEYKETQSSSNDEEKQSRGKKKRRGSALRRICSASFDDTNFSACTSEGNTVTDKAALCENNEGVTIVHMGSCGNCEREQLCPARKPRNVDENESLNAMKNAEAAKKMFEFFCNFKMARCEQFEQDGTILKLRDYKKSEGLTNGDKTGKQPGGRRGQRKTEETENVK